MTKDWGAIVARAHAYKGGQSEISGGNVATSVVFAINDEDTPIFAPQSHRVSILASAHHIAQQQRPYTHEKIRNRRQRETQDLL